MNTVDVRPRLGMSFLGNNDFDSTQYPHFRPDLLDDRHVFMMD